MPPVVCNANCDCDILLDYILRRAVKDTEAYTRVRDAQLRAALQETERTISGLTSHPPEAGAAQGQSQQHELARLQKVKAHQLQQTEALMHGINKFKGMQDARYTNVDLLDPDGHHLKLYSEPKRRAAELLTSRHTYTLAKRDPATPVTQKSGTSVSKAKASGSVADQETLTPLTFELPSDIKP